MHQRKNFSFELGFIRQYVEKTFFGAISCLLENTDGFRRSLKVGFGGFFVDARALPGAHEFGANKPGRGIKPAGQRGVVDEAPRVLREREKHIQSLQRELGESHDQFTALHAAHEQLTMHLEEQNRWALRTSEELEAVRRDLVTLLEKLTAAEATVVERTLWGQRLAAQVEDLTEDLTARLNLWRASRWTKLGRKLNLGPVLDKDDASGGGS